MGNRTRKEGEEEVDGSGHVAAQVLVLEVTLRWSIGGEERLEGVDFVQSDGHKLLVQVEALVMAITSAASSSQVASWLRPKAQATCALTLLT